MRAEGARHDIAILLGLLRPTGGENLDWAPAAQWDWRGFASACDLHHVSPFVYYRFQRLTGITISPGLREHLRARFIEVSGRNYHLAQKLVELISLLQDHGIPALAFKGPTLALAAYGDLALRWYDDLDLVIHHHDLVKAVGLMTGCGFEIWGKAKNPASVARYHEMIFRAPDKSYFVDLHWQLAPHKARAFRLDVEKTWDRAEKVELLRASIPTLCREDLFLALCCHGTVHRWKRLKWLLDVAELLHNGPALNWSRIEEMTSNRPLARAAASHAALLARDLLNVDLPTEALRILPATERIRAVTGAVQDEILLAGETSGNNYTTLLGLEGNLLAWAKYYCVHYPALLFREAFVTVRPSDRALVSLPERFQFLYHVIRPVRLMFKHSERAVRALWSMAR